MRHDDKAMTVQSGANQLFGVDFYDLIQKEQHVQNIEFSSEFGLTNQDVKKIKKRLERN